MTTQYDSIDLATRLIQVLDLHGIDEGTIKEVLSEVGLPDVSIAAAMAQAEIDAIKREMQALDDRLTELLREET